LVEKTFKSREGLEEKLASNFLESLPSSLLSQSEVQQQ
jgi:hypothetical protein